MAHASQPNPDADPFRPPAIPTEVRCIHCGREFESYLIEWREEEVEGERRGRWCCPTPGCDGAGFGFDILPTDPEYRDEHGEKFWDDEEDEEDESDALFADEDELDEELTDFEATFGWEDDPEEFGERFDDDDEPPRHR